MGQKTNPNIFRLGKTNTWTSQYFEKKPREQSVYSFRDLEIKKFINIFFRNNGLTPLEIRLYHSDNSLHICVSYFLGLKSTALVGIINKNQGARLVPQKNEAYKQRRSYKTRHKKIRISTKRYSRYEKLDYNNLLGKQKNNKLKVKRVIKLERNIFKIRRIKLLKYYKKYLLTRNYNNINNIKANSFLEKFFESLSLFTNEKLNIYLSLNQLNLNFKQSITKEGLKHLKKGLIQLRKFKQTGFFKEGINLLFTSATNNNSANLIAEFIAEQLKKLKKHNFFLKFIETALTLFSTSSFSNLKGIKIKVKGRFNGAPRAKHKIINIAHGTPVLTLKSKINYSESTSYTSNGTFGVKVWMYRNLNNYVKRTKTN